MKRSVEFTSTEEVLKINNLEKLERKLSCTKKEISSIKSVVFEG